jgi:hypothetical protein
MTGEWRGKLTGASLAGVAGEVGGTGEVAGEGWRGLAGKVGGGGWRGTGGGGRRGRLAGRIERTNSSKSSLVFRLLLSLPQVDTAEPVHDVHRTVPSRLCPVKSPFSETPDDHVPVPNKCDVQTSNYTKMMLRNLLS